MNHKIEQYVDGKLVEKIKPKRQTKLHRIDSKRLRDLYSRQKPDWLYEESKLFFEAQNHAK